MKCLIIRTGSSKINIKTYNMQEIGLAKALIRKGNQCDIIYYAADGVYKEEIINFDDDKSLKIYWLNGHSILNNAIFDKKRLLNICSQYDVIQVAEYDQYTSYFLVKNRIKPVVIYHGPYYCKFKKKYNIVNKIFDILFLRKYKTLQPSIITKSKLAEEYLRNKGFGNVVTIGVGIDSERFDLKNKKSIEVENILNKMKNKKIILYIGQLEDRRSVDFIIKTYSKVYKEDKNTALLIIGKGSEKYTNMCKTLTNNLEITDNVVFISSINQEYLKEIYKNSSVFLLASKYEIFGMVLLEAMYFEVPVITTYNGGSSTVIDNKKSGFIIKSLDEESWKNQIIDVLNNKMDKIVRNGKRVIENYTWDNLAEKFISVYEGELKK